MARVVVDLTVRALTDEDLPACGWAGSATHLAAVARELARVRADQADYLAVCPPSNLPVAIGGIDYEAVPGGGWLHQLAVHPALQSCGIGTVLIGAAERRILARGMRRAELAVEQSNPRAQALYERLGYVAYGHRPGAWDVETTDGSLIRYETVCTVMRKDL